MDIPLDPLVEILVRLPPNARRRFRLVCRLWRELVDQRTTTDMRSRTKIIAVTDKGTASIIDVMSRAVRESLWCRTDALCYGSMSIIGTCNGIVCMCDDQEPAGGAITLANPSTGEALSLPRLPIPSANHGLDLGSIGRSWHQTYSFAYHPTTTGRYKVVHVPHHADRLWEPGMIHVFTLGEASWRGVHVGTDARCRLGHSSLTDIDGMVYWLTEDTRRIMEFDLRQERVTCTEALPLPPVPSTCHLKKVHGRLGVVVGYDNSVTVWILEDDRWSRWYTLEVHGIQRHEEWLRRELAVPLFVHGDYFITSGRSGQLFALYRQKISEAARSQDNVVPIIHTYHNDLVGHLVHPIIKTFTYIETNEPLRVYNAALVHKSLN